MPGFIGTFPSSRKSGACSIKTATCDRGRHVTMAAAPISRTDSAGHIKWECMSQCGACCKLDDFDPDVLQEMLKNEADVVEYLDMVGADGWCKWFDTFSRKCTKYETRPRFCRATPEVFNQLYDVPSEEFDTFAVSCCDFHIANTYGEESQEVSRYNRFKQNAFEHTPPHVDEID